MKLNLGFQGLPFKITKVCYLRNVSEFVTPYTQL